MPDAYGWLRNDPWFRRNTDNVPDEELDSAVERIKRDLNGTILSEAPIERGTGHSAQEDS